MGRNLGDALAPWLERISAARQARTFHPEGIVYAGHVAAEPHSPFPALAARLDGPVLARFSAALWKGAPRWFDVLGIALRFGDDQDLLLATIRSPFTMPFSPLGTDTRDHAANRYWAVSPFEVAGEGRLKFRLRPRARDAAWLLEARRVFQWGYHPLARIELARVADEVDQAALRFDPYRNGRGITPSGLVHSIRPAAYAASQRGRARAHGRSESATTMAAGGGFLRRG
ncbi:MAG: hypothetical protein K8M05_06105 [Deltaproteobacteria bacterium]|nr:hypothetical protein [Kofleriaceae bacterium]